MEGMNSAWRVQNSEVLCENWSCSSKRAAMRGKRNANRSSINSSCLSVDSKTFRRTATCGSNAIEKPRPGASNFRPNMNIFTPRIRNFRLRLNRFLKRGQSPASFASTASRWRCHIQPTTTCRKPRTRSLGHAGREPPLFFGTDRRNAIVDA